MLFDSRPRKKIVYHHEALIFADSLSRITSRDVLLATPDVLSGKVNHFDVNFMIPVSMCDENMKRAHKRDAINKEKFWFNTNCFPAELPESELVKNDFLKSNAKS